jgi:CheY-like chemotaxis protein
MSQNVPPARTRLDGIRVLLVEDESDARELLSFFLAASGAEVVTAASPREALSALATSSPNVLVSDIGMPGQDGYAFMRDLRASAGNGARIPSLALTAFTGADHRARASAAGFSEYLNKPADLDVVASTIARLAVGTRA